MGLHTGGTGVLLVCMGGGRGGRQGRRVRASIYRVQLYGASSADLGCSSSDLQLHYQVATASVHVVASCISSISGSAIACSLDRLLLSNQRGEGEIR